MKRPTVVTDASGYKMWYAGVNADGVQQIGLAMSEAGLIWEKSTDNPVMPLGELGSWNDATVSHPSVLFVDGVYHMWYVGRSTTSEAAIGYASSLDGMSWEDYSDNPVLTATPLSSWDADYVTVPHVIQTTDSTFLMAYSGYASGHHQVGLAESSDGINWIKLSQEATIPVGEPGSWNGDAIMGPSLVQQSNNHLEVWYAGNMDYENSTAWSIGHGHLYGEGRRVEDPDFIYEELGDGAVFNGSMDWNDLAVVAPHVHPNESGYGMWYVGRNVNMPMQIGYAESEDGFQWNELTGPILSPGNTNDFDGAQVKKPTVIQDADGYKMWYVGVDASGLQQIGLATSEDGLTWEKHGGNPVMTVGTTGTWKAHAAHMPSVLYLDGEYHLWYVGTSDQGVGSIGYATSSDGVTWNDHPNNPVMTAQTLGDWAVQSITAPHVIPRSAGGFLMAYSGYDGVHREVGLAHSSNGVDWNPLGVGPMIPVGPAGSWNGDTILGPCLTAESDSTFRVWYAGNMDYSTSTTWTIGSGRLTLLATLAMSGDLNGDDISNISDLLIMINYIVGTDPPYENLERLADLNGDGQVNISDVILLVEIILGT